MICRYKRMHALYSRTSVRLCVCASAVHFAWNVEAWYYDQITWVALLYYGRLHRIVDARLSGHTILAYKQPHHTRISRLTVRENNVVLVHPAQFKTTTPIIVVVTALMTSYNTLIPAANIMARWSRRRNHSHIPHMNMNGNMKTIRIDKMYTTHTHMPYRSHSYQPSLRFALFSSLNPFTFFSCSVSALYILENVFAAQCISWTFSSARAEQK